MTYRQVGNSLRRIDYEYNNLTDFGSINNLNKCFNLKNVDIIIEKKYNNERMFIINELTIDIKRKEKTQINKLLMNKILPEEIGNKIIDEYVLNYKHIHLKIHIEYDLHKYPIEPPIWKLISLKNNGFVNETENAIISIIDFHNEILQNDWSCAITLRVDLIYFISKLIKIIKYI
jgi:hypothetical protein